VVGEESASEWSGVVKPGSADAPAACDLLLPGLSDGIATGRAGAGRRVLTGGVCPGGVWPSESKDGLTERGIQKEEQGRANGRRREARSGGGRAGGPPEAVVEAILPQARVRNGLTADRTRDLDAFLFARRGVAGEQKWLDRGSNAGPSDSLRYHFSLTLSQLS
jgi:hypothetical protein